MAQLLFVFEKFEIWFNNNFGWFFINGRKQSEKFES